MASGTVMVVRSLSGSSSAGTMKIWPRHTRLGQHRAHRTRQPCSPSCTQHSQCPMSKTHAGQTDMRRHLELRAHLVEGGGARVEVHVGRVPPQPDNQAREKPCSRRPPSTTPLVTVRCTADHQKRVGKCTWGQREVLDVDAEQAVVPEDARVDLESVVGRQHPRDHDREPLAVGDGVGAGLLQRGAEVQALDEADHALQPLRVPRHPRTHPV
eukprot:2399729-Rhodomonas_salina.3